MTDKPWPPIPGQRALIETGRAPDPRGVALKVGSLEEARAIVREIGERATFVDHATGTRYDLGANGEDVIDIDPAGAQLFVGADPGVDDATSIVVVQFGPDGTAQVVTEGTFSNRPAPGPSAEALQRMYDKLTDMLKKPDR